MKNFEKILSYIFPAVVLAGFLGRGVFNVSVLLVLLLSIALYRKMDFDVLRRDPVLRGWFIFLFFVLVANIFAIELSFSLKKFSVFAIYSFVVLGSGRYLYGYSMDRDGNLERAVSVLTFTALFVSLLVIANTLAGIDLLEYIRKGVKVPQYGNYHFRLSIAVNIFAISFYWSMKKRLPYLLISVMAVETMGVFCSGSRTAMVAFVGMLAVFVFVKNGKRIFSRELFITVFLVGAAVWASYILSPYAKIRIGSFDTTFLPKGDHMSGRYELFAATAGEISKSLLYGRGVKSAVKHPVEYGASSSKHPHNIYLEVLLDSGLVGFIPFLFFLWVLYRSFTGVGTDAAPALYASLAGLFLTSLASWSIWSANHISVMMTVLAVLLGMSASSGKRMGS